MKKRSYPNTHLGWHKYYVHRFNKNEHPDAAYLACLYLYFHLAAQDAAEAGSTP